MTTYSPRQFALFRIALGIYVATFALLIFPYATELLSDQGMLQRYSGGIRFFRYLLPNPLEWYPSPGFVHAFVATVALLGLGLALGVGRRFCALGAWYGMACLVDRNDGFTNPALPFVGWLCLATTLVPLGEGWSLFLRDARENWRMPRALFRAAWIVMAVAYTYSGLVKLQSQAWVEGSALRYVVDMPFAREAGFAALFAALPGWALAILTYVTLLGEIAFLPASYWRIGRAIVWSTMVGMHLLLLLVMSFPELTAGMLLVHLFTFDRRWYMSAWSLKTE